MDPSTVLAPNVSNITIGSRIKEIAASLNRFNQDARLMLHNLPKRFVVVVGICHHSRLDSFMAPTTILASLVSNVCTVGCNSRSWIKEVAPRHNRFKQDAALQLNNLPKCFVVVVSICHYSRSTLPAGGAIFAVSLNTFGRTIINRIEEMPPITQFVQLIRRIEEAPLYVESFSGRLCTTHLAWIVQLIGHTSNLYSLNSADLHGHVQR